MRTCSEYAPALPNTYIRSGVCGAHTAHVLKTRDAQQIKCQTWMCTYKINLLCVCVVWMEVETKRNENRYATIAVEVVVRMDHDCKYTSATPFRRDQPPRSTHHILVNTYTRAANSHPPNHDAPNTPAASTKSTTKPKPIQFRSSHTPYVSFLSLILQTGIMLSRSHLTYLRCYLYTVLTRFFLYYMLMLYMARLYMYIIHEHTRVAWHVWVYYNYTMLVEAHMCIAWTVYSLGNFSTARLFWWYHVIGTPHTHTHTCTCSCWLNIVQSGDGGRWATQNNATMATTQRAPTASEWQKHMISCYIIHRTNLFFLLFHSTVGVVCLCVFGIGASESVFGRRGPREPGRAVSMVMDDVYISID